MWILGCKCVVATWGEMREFLADLDVGSEDRLASVGTQVRRYALLGNHE